jgi:hypothetical protein
MKNEYVKLFTDTNIIINGLKKLLEKENINYRVKDNFESARLGGFGQPSASVELHVLENDLAKAEIILKDYKEKINA